MIIRDDTPSLVDHPMEVFHAGEIVDTASDRAWDRYVRQCEKRMGLSTLDGDERIDGYSLDSALIAFEAGVPSERYAAGERVAGRWMGACG